MRVAKPGTVDQPRVQVGIHSAVQAVKDKIVLVEFSNDADKFIFQVEKSSNRSQTEWRSDALSQLEHASRLTVALRLRPTTSPSSPTLFLTALKETSSSTTVDVVTGSVFLSFRVLLRFHNSATLASLGPQGQGHRYRKFLAISSIDPLVFSIFQLIQEYPRDPRQHPPTPCARNYVQRIIWFGMFGLTGGVLDNRDFVLYSHINIHIISVISRRWHLSNVSSVIRWHIWQMTDISHIDLGGKRLYVSNWSVDSEWKERNASENKKNKWKLRNFPKKKVYSNDNIPWKTIGSLF